MKKAAKQKPAGTKAPKAKTLVQYDDRGFKSFMKCLWRDKALVVMALPAVVLMIMFNYIPMTGLVLAFKRFDFSAGLYASPWNGFENFKQLFLVGDTFWRITRNTVGYYLLFTALETVCSIALAIAINELVFKKIGKYTHSILIMPTFISFVAVSYIVKALLDYNTGFINSIIASGGGEKINFYLQASYWPFILALVHIWKNTGYASVLYLSVLSGIDPELYNSASLDGAGTWKRIRYITIPMLVPMMIIKLLLGLGNIMHSDTGMFYQVTRNTGALYETTQVLDSYVLNTIMNPAAASAGYGVVAATTFYQSVVGLVMILIVNGIVRKFSPENAMF